MTVRTLGVSALLAATLLAGPALARDPDPLANLIKAAAHEPNPVLAFLHGFAEGGDDVSFDQPAIRRALVEANLTEGPLSEVLWATKGIKKQGKRLELERASKTRIPLAGGHLQLGKRVRLDIERRPLVDAAGKDRERLAGAEGQSYVKIENTKGIKVSKSGRWYSFFKLDDLYAFQEGGAPAVVFHAGPPVIGKWVKRKLGAELPAETTPIVEAPIVEEEQQGVAGALGEAVDVEVAPQPQAETEIVSKPQDETETAPQAEAETAPQAEAETTPQAETETAPVVAPPADPVEKARIDDEVEDASSDFATMQEELKQMVALWKKNQDEARKQLEARIKELDAENERLDAQIAELRKREANRGRALPYGPRVDVPRYDPRTINDPRYRAPITPIDPRTGQPLPIDPRTGQPVPAEKPSMLERLLSKILEGVAKGLQDRFLGSATTNANARANALALGTAPANQPYVGASLNRAGIVATTPITRVNTNTRGTLNLPLGYQVVRNGVAQPRVSQPRVSQPTRVPVASTPIVPANSGTGTAVIKR